MSVACFLLLLSCRDAIDIGCIDRAITATLETARVSGGVSVMGGRPGRMRAGGGRDAATPRKSFAIDGAQLCFSHGSLIRWGVHTPSAG